MTGTSITLLVILWIVLVPGSLLLEAFRESIKAQDTATSDMMLKMRQERWEALFGKQSDR